MGVGRMPFSALSLNGPAMLLGVNPLTVEQMRDRNRRQKLYAAKCNVIDNAVDDLVSAVYGVSTSAF